jgi:hypothetical protein
MSQASVLIKMGEKDEASSAYINAGKAYKKSSPLGIPTPPSLSFLLSLFHLSIYPFTPTIHVPNTSSLDILNHSIFMHLQMRQQLSSKASFSSQKKAASQLLLQTKNNSLKSTSKILV